MKVLKSLFLCVAVLFCVVGIALADWDPGMPYKMLNPQEPNPSGWDVCLVDQVIADDFVCAESGDITDIHFWTSWKFGEVANGETYNIAIADDAAGIPGPIVWTWNGSGTLVTRLYGQGNQGWYCPSTGITQPNDHFEIYQVNITNIQNAFVQEAGKVYWLIIGAQVPTHPSSTVGWKTSFGHRYGAPAVWQTALGGWQPIIAIDFTDMAFVITNDGTSQSELDFGDAPEVAGAGGYPTKLGNNGARHIIGGPFFDDSSGVADPPDAEIDGQQDPQALGDDNDVDGDDEDGVQISPMIIGQPANIDFVVAGGGGIVEIWIDWNKNFTWEAAELVHAAGYPDGTYSQPITPPAAALTGQTFARCRISTLGTGSPVGQAPDGEVEDHIVDVDMPPDDPNVKICSVAGFDF